MRAERYLLISPSGLRLVGLSRGDVADEIRAWRNDGQSVHRWRDTANATRFYVYTEVGCYCMRPEHTEVFA